MALTMWEDIQNAGSHTKVIPGYALQRLRCKNEGETESKLMEV